jgi:hypothetical protein
VGVASFLAPAEIAPALDELPAVFPTADELHDDVDPNRNAAFRTEFGGIVDFPWSGIELNLLAVHPHLVALATALAGTDDLRLVSAEAWAKYTGAADYEQQAHRDYLNHTPLVPTDDPRFRQVEMFVYLSDVTDAHGPPHFVSRQVTGSPPALPNWFSRAERPLFYDEEVAATGPAGTVVAFEIGTFQPNGPYAMAGPTEPSAPTGTSSCSEHRPASWSCSASRHQATPSGTNAPSTP